MSRMLVIPAGTAIFEPNAINEVTLQFGTANDAIIFYQWLMTVLGTTRAESEPLPDSKEGK